jgi:hypothetical protein
MMPVRDGAFRSKFYGTHIFKVGLNAVDTTSIVLGPKLRHYTVTVQAPQYECFVVAGRYCRRARDIRKAGTEYGVGVHGSIVA